MILERLALTTIQPSVILDLGCGAGELSGELKKQYPEANIIAVDDNETMLSFARSKQQNIEFLSGKAEVIPLPNQSVDVIVLHFLLPWIADFKTVIKECQRVLRPNGLLMLSALGPDTLKELSDPENIIPYFYDMHDLGDALMHEGFSDPVMEVNHFTLTYRDLPRLFDELIATGMLINPENMTVIQQPDASYEITHEVIIGHAWRSDEKTNKYSADGSVRIPISVLKK